ncbi:bifunctional DNA primase/polymerase [Nonomuraea candida]|uniref:bifunctional DNA primase/polymerase n=1 Tax=Nonomuraea candida TaxID=359159 RepID=UPI00146FE69B|nr:bifunctional DNA primase/polymerase [Nonomuraea candida]
MTEHKRLAAALTYVGQGWPVFPCIPGGKRPIGRFAPNGLHNATTDIELVSWWWTSEPDANIAIPTGRDTFDVLDVDQKPDGTGWPAFNRCKAAGLLPEPYAINGTPSGGIHAMYVGTDQACGSLRKHHLDFKAAGGYILMPPSVVQGRAYTLITERPGARNQLNWSEVRSFLDPPKPVQVTRLRASNGTGVDHLATWLSGKTKPGRNQALFWAACRAVENGATEQELHELYRSMQFGNGFDERQAARTVADAFRITNRRSA